MTPLRNLHAVAPSPEQRLRAAFKREDELIAELAKVRAGQRDGRREYAAAHGLLILPSMETLRKVLLNG